MVFFTCSHCGESVKKPSVAKHYQMKCRNLTPFVTCVDCLKDFKGNEYEAHTKCFTEEEKYSAKGFVPKPSAHKGERKQQAWSECVQGLLSQDKLQPDEKSLLEAICKHENIPRKKAKFINFLKSTARMFSNKPELIDRVWDKLDNYFKEVNAAAQKDSETGNSENQKKKRKQSEMSEGDDDNNAEGEQSKKKKKKNSAETTEKQNGEQNGEEVGKKGKRKKKRPSEGEKEEMNGEDEPKSKKAKKLKKNEQANGVKETDDKENVNQKKKKAGKGENEVGKEDTEDDTEETETFDWTDAIMNVLKQSGAKNQIKLGKLKKKVLKKYGEVKGCEVDDKITKKFSKKLNKIESVNVNGEYVTLKS